jgi:glycosyltransferase involved in cell wall biosynthesis
MHICFLCNEYPPQSGGGIGSFTQTLARALVKSGHHATVVGVERVHRTVSETDAGVQVIRLPHTRAPGFGVLVHGNRVARALADAHAHSPIDVIEGPENALAFLPHPFIAPKTIRMHGGHHFFAVTLGQRPRGWRSWIERRSFSRADFVCAVSRFVGETTSKLLGLDPRRVEIIPNPVNLAIFHPRRDVDTVKGLVLFTGTVTEKKGVRQLVLAMSEIAAAVPDARLQIVGRDSIDPQTGESYTKFLTGLLPPAVAARVQFTGPVPNSSIPDVLAKAAVCVFPSHMEAMPIAPLEAMAMGKPVVVSQAGPGPEVITGGATGLFCDPYDPHSVASAIIQMLSDPVMARRLGERAAEVARARFSVEVLVERNIQWYRHCADEFRVKRSA